MGECKMRVIEREAKRQKDRKQGQSLDKLKEIKQFLRKMVIP